MTNPESRHSSKAAPRETGSYALLLHLPESQRLAIGKLGVHDFQAGYYLYYGSALNGLRARVERHLRQEKKLHWHIDYLTASASQIIAWQLADGQPWECVWAKEASAHPSVQAPVKGFGSSDCRCPTHLYRVETPELARDLLCGFHLPLHPLSSEGRFGTEAHQDRP